MLVPPERTISLLPDVMTALLTAWPDETTVAVMISPAGQAEPAS
jgi:hypothetical protein